MKPPASAATTIMAKSAAIPIQARSWGDADCQLERWRKAVFWRELRLLAFLKCL
jgi:hypothetical protein